MSICTTIFTQYHVERKILNNVRRVLIKVTIRLDFAAHGSIRNSNHPEQLEVIGGGLAQLLHIFAGPCAQSPPHLATAITD